MRRAFIVAALLAAIAAPTLADGTAYYRNTDYAHAVTDYSAAVKLSPDCGHCFNNRGMAWQDNGDLAKANDDLTADQLAH